MRFAVRNWRTRRRRQRPIGRNAFGTMQARTDRTRPFGPVSAFPIPTAFGHALLLAAAVYALAALAARFRWRRQAAAIPSPAAGAAVTVLKPLFGAEPRLYDNLRSFCQQDHPQFQLLFGLHAADDAARPVVERLQREFPALDIGMVIDERVHGINLKVGNLINLLPQARHDWLLLADSDIAAPPDLLRRATAALADPTVGVVTCLYGGRPIGHLWARLGAQFIDDWFVPSVALSQAFGGSRFAFGASIALRREVLAASGGFEALADHVADDWWLGELSRRAGFRTVLSECTVTTDVIETRLSDLAARELRWLRSIRRIEPLGYAFSFVCFTFPVLAIGWSLAGGGVIASSLALSALAARLMLGVHGNRNPLDVLENMALIPLRDSLSLLLWTLALAGRVVRWRGRPMKIAPHASRRRRTSRKD